MRKQIIHGSFDGKINYKFNKCGRFNGIINLINDGGFKWENQLSMGDLDGKIKYQWRIFHCRPHSKQFPVCPSVEINQV